MSQASPGSKHCMSATAALGLRVQRTRGSMSSAAYEPHVFQLVSEPNVLTANEVP